MPGDLFFCRAARRLKTASLAPAHARRSWHDDDRQACIAHRRPDRIGFLNTARELGADEFGNPLQPFGASGGEPVRCCLRRVTPGESIALISYSPHRRPSPWAEVGPVFVHAAPCSGPTSRVSLPEGLRGGGRVVRAYRPDGSMNYDANVLLDDDRDLAVVVERALDRPDVHELHVRTALPQCFLYAIRRG